MIFVFFWIFFLVALVFIVAGFTGAPFVPSRDHHVTDLLSIIEIETGTRTADLGSGDGRLVIAMAQAGADAHGYEINPFLVLWSVIRIFRSGVWGRAHIHWRSYWSADLSSYDIVTIYGSGPLMPRFKEKLCRELAGNARIICNTFQLPDMRPLRQKNNIYLYVPKFSDKSRLYD